ncbi:uncharacterized protein SCHCODRAFT_02511191 [Schizophyllum commune H4-8]|uniref:uncharacterized protein n=1 Tax=Schizophyllum commune (strain H4-8 / FGSC 9210) TaxID=578458 RepID=UPI00215FDEE7|nr:uncharacterized protein SCHCODRAFT_02511191 [Schizophyllum commune H4-8]KAI5889628.1 hypothetical protein SCHCODRAFT_02511191 [Schizophyllum commune H4-8]
MHAGLSTATRLLKTMSRYFRRNVQGILGPWATTRVGKILVLLVESGLVYCLIWVVYLVINITEGPNTLAAYGVISAAYHSIAGIYPTFIVLVVAMQRSAAESICETRVSHSVHFASSGKGKGRSTDDTGTTTDTYTNATNIGEDSSWLGHPPSGLETAEEHIMMSTIPSHPSLEITERTETRGTKP